MYADRVMCFSTWLSAQFVELYAIEPWHLCLLVYGTQIFCSVCRPTHLLCACVRVCVWARVYFCISISAFMYFLLLYGKFTPYETQISYRFIWFFACFSRHIVVTYMKRRYVFKRCIFTFIIRGVLLYCDFCFLFFFLFTSILSHFNVESVLSLGYKSGKIAPKNSIKSRHQYISLKILQHTCIHTNQA